MLIGNVLEKSKAEQAWQLCADKLGDAIRNCWLENTKLGLKNWEEAFSEDPDAMAGLRTEGFGNVVGIDYIFKWWGAQDTDELAGGIVVVWKLMEDSEEERIACYRTWIKVAERDFILGLYADERGKREANRAAFRDAFAQWKELFANR